MEAAGVVLCLLGSFSMLLAAVGLLRMPDLFTRMSATSKAATLGAVFVLTGAALSFDDLGIAVRALGSVVFLFLTAPVASHLIGRAAYRNGEPLWPGTRVNEFPRERTGRPETRAGSGKDPG